MSSIRQYDGAGEAEKTLRMIAQLPAPEGLEERVKAVLKSGKPAGHVLAWPAGSGSARSGHLRPGDLWPGFMRAAAAAAIVCVVGGGGWGIYSRVQQGQSARSVAPPPHAVSSGGFSNAGAMRTPQTLVGPDAPHAASTQVKAAETTPETVDKTVRGRTSRLRRKSSRLPWRVQAPLHTSWKFIEDHDKILRLPPPTSTPKSKDRSSGTPE